MSSIRMYIFCAVPILTVLPSMQYQVYFLIVLYKHNITIMFIIFYIVQNSRVVPLLCDVRCVSLHISLVCLVCYIITVLVFLSLLKCHYSVFGMLCFISVMCCIDMLLYIALKKRKKILFYHIAVLFCTLCYLNYTM